MGEGTGSCCGPRVLVHTARSLTGKVSPSPTTLMRLGSLSSPHSQRQAVGARLRSQELQHSNNVGTTNSVKKSTCPVAV
jgi:hypothetical protein